MKKFYIAQRIGLSLFFLFSVIYSFSQESLTITIPDIEIDPGQSMLVTAEYTDSSGTVQDVKIKWNTEPGYLGKVDKNGNLTANHSGEGVLIAKYKELRDSVNLKVTGIVKGDGEEDDYPKVKVIPGKIKVALGDSVELAAFYINEFDEKVDTSFTWEVLPPELGHFPDSSVSMFYADSIGKGFIVASLGDLADTVKLEIQEPKVKANKGNNSRQMQITPGDTVVALGSILDIQYEAEYKTNGNKHEGAELMWSISGDSIGTIDASTGLLVLSGETGLALIKAEYSNFSASVELLVVDSLVDPVVNTITIHRVLPDGTELPAKSFNEGESYKIGGLPFPLNILNGGMLHFPFGCIDEDILIYMFIPEEYAEVDEDSVEVEFTDEIITGVKFNVMPAGSDSIVEPYYFNIPLNLSLVFKHGLLDSLGISPENLDVFFAENTGFVQVNDGSGNIAVDTVKNKIYAAIEHFSTIIVKQKESKTFVEQRELDEDEMMVVYPNPFSVSTQIAFKLAEKSDIDLTVYNLSGQIVRVLAHGEKTKGLHTVNWNGQNENGSPSSPGIYLCRMLVNGEKTVVKRLVLSR